MKIKILGKNNKKNFLKENCGVPAEPVGDMGAPSLDNMTPQEAFDAGYSAAIDEISAVVMEMMPGGDPVEAEIEVPVAIADVSQLEEKWKGDAEIEQTGEWAGKTVAQLRKRKKALMDKEERTKEEQEEVREINFAIRAKTGWKRGEGATK
jgi:hypothetical protein|tara:strand:+ start:3124 stop:3576 length:453 start_codon:yes stop_codon:yes gene_type:complete